MNLALVLQLVGLFNAAEPGIASLIMLIRKKDGTVAVATFLDEADAGFDANLKQAADWFKAHPGV